MARIRAAVGRVTRALPRPARLDRRRLRVAAVAVIVVALAASGVLAMVHRSATEESRASREVVKLAKTVTPEVLSYDFAAIDAYRTRARDLTTGAFQRELTTLIDDTIIPAATKDKIVTRATVPTVSVVSASGGRVVLLVFVNQVTRKDNGTPRVEGSRVRVTFTKSDETWRISRLEPV